jgi:hypothetical protein
VDFPVRSVAQIPNSFCCGTLPRLWHAYLFSLILAAAGAS